MVIMITIETKYTAPFFQFYYLFYLLYLSDLSSSWTFSSPPSVLSFFIVLNIIVYYLRIITMKKLIHLDCLAYYCCCTYFVSIDSLSIKTGLTFYLICTVYKSFFRIL